MLDHLCVNQITLVKTNSVEQSVLAVDINIKLLNTWVEKFSVLNIFCVVGAVEKFFKTFFAKSEGGTDLFGGVAQTASGQKFAFIK